MLEVEPTGHWQWPKGPGHTVRCHRGDSLLFNCGEARVEAPGCRISA